MGAGARVRQHTDAGSQLVDEHEYLEFFTAQLIAELRPTKDLKRLTSNPQLLGAYTEAAVRELVRKVVHPLQVCTGSVPDMESLQNDDLPEIDTIVWTPNPAPPVFTTGSFGIVPQSSSFGILEIKRSLYSRDAADSLRKRTGGSFAKKHTSELLADPSSVALGVVCVKHLDQSLAPIQDLIDAGRVAVLFEEAADSWGPRPVDVVRLVNCLTRMKAAARQCVGGVMLNEQLLEADKA
jgi:hypothetical protein